MVDWQTGMSGSRAGFGELMDDGAGGMMEEGRAIISCWARCWSVTVQGTAMERQAVEGAGEVGPEGWSVREKTQSPAQGLGVGSCLGGARPHAGQDRNALLHGHPWAAACPGVLLTLGLQDWQCFLTVPSLL